MTAPADKSATQNTKQPEARAAAVDIASRMPENPGENPLLSCLVYMSGLFGDQRSAESLNYGLATDGKMTPQNLIDAAERAGYTAHIKKCGFKEISSAMLPCIVTTKTGGAVLVIAQPNKKTVRVFDPEVMAEVDMARTTLAKNYNGYSFFVRQPVDLDNDTSGHSHVEMPEKHWFWSVVRGNYGNYSLAMLAAVFVNVFALAGPLFVMNVYDRVLPNNATETGWVLAVAVVVVYLFDLIIRTLRGYFIDVASRRSDVILARKLFDQILDMKLMTRPGSIGSMSNSLREFDTVREFMTSATILAFVDVPFGLFFIGVIWIIGGPIAAMLVGVFLALVALTILIQIPVKSYIFKAMKGSEIKHNLLLETLYNLETVKGVGGAGRLRKQYTDVVGQSAYYSQQSKIWAGLANNLTAFTQQSTSVFIILIGMYMVADQTLTVGGLIACVILSGRALAPIAQLSALIGKYHHTKIALSSLNKVMAIPKERTAGRRYLSRPKLNGHFLMKGVSHVYPDQRMKSLDNVSLEIKSGERVGIVGRIGSGKSTLVKTMMNFYAPTEGVVHIDDTDVGQIDPADLRKNIAYVSQDPGLFRGTVRENITLSKPNASDGEVLRASKLAGVFDFINTHPDGFDAMVGDNGEGFSGGQKQAIAMARAFLTDPNIMICDEPTNAMDSQSEAQLIAALARQTQGKTFVVVTHKLNLLTLVDRVIVMQNGQIYADGPRDKVLEMFTNASKAQASGADNRAEEGNDGKE